MRVSEGDRAYHLRRGTVTVLQSGESLVRLGTPGGDYFWARRDELLDTAGSGPEAEFVARLARQGYCFNLRVIDRNEYELGAVEYLEWCGEPLGEECVYWRPRPRAQDHKGRWIREWRLSYVANEGLDAPFPITVMGTSDPLVHSGRREHEQGLFTPRSRRVEVNFRTIIARLVKAGLRATEIKRR